MKSTLDHLVHAGGAAQAAPSYRVLGRDNDQVSGYCPEHFAVAAAERMYSQGSESNSSWCSDTMSSFMVPTEVVGAASVSCSGIPHVSGPCPLLLSEITVVVSSHPLQTMQEAPCPT